MKVMAFNGSARKNGNTAALLQKALDGAAECGAETELVHLYDLSYKGCRGCFSCKLLNGSSYGKCIMRDELTPVTERALEADALILGSPIYFGDVTGEMRSFFERLAYPCFTYNAESRSLWPKKCKSAFIYTMGVPSGDIYRPFLQASLENIADAVFKNVTSLSATCTKHVKDYSLIYCPSIDPENKGVHFSEDCEKACELGKRLVSE